MNEFEPTCPPLPEVTAGLAIMVDDVEVNRVLACAHLEMLGWKVIDFESGQAALKHLHHQIPEAMLIDIRMPGMSGDELVRRVRMLAGAEVKLVGYTAHCMPEDIRRFMNSGFDHVLIKPVSLGDMAKVLSRK